MTTSDNFSFAIVNDIISLKEVWRKFDSIATDNIANDKLPRINYTFYQTYIWNEFVENHYARKAAVKYGLKHIEYVVISLGGETKAIMPLMVSSKSVEMTSWRTAGVNNIVLPYVGAEAEKLCQSFAEFLRTHYKGKKLKLFDIPSGSPFARALAALPDVKYTERGSFHIPLSNFKDFDEYYASLNKKLRHNIKTRSNHFTHGDLSCELKVFTHDNAPTDEYWKKIWRLFYLRKNIWRKREITFLRKLISKWEVYNECNNGLRMDSFRKLGQTILFVFEINGEPAAFAFLYLHNNYILVPKLAIDTSLRAHAPGILMLKEIMKWCYEHDVKDFDLCRGEEPYKLQMGAVCEQVCRIETK